MDEATRIVGEFVREYPLPLIRHTLEFTVLSALSGLLLAVVSFLTLRRVGGYRWDWPHSKWFRGLTLIVMIALLPLFLGIVGFYEGLYRSGERILNEGRLAEDVYPFAGRVGADFVAILYLLADEANRNNGVVQEISVAKIDLREFREGAWELDVDSFSRRIGTVPHRLVQQVIPPLKNQAPENYPALRKGLGKRILDWTIDGIAWTLFGKCVENIAKGNPLYMPASEFLDGMRKQARESGDPRTLSHRELSVYVVKATVVRPLLRTIRPFVRAEQLLSLVLCVLTICLPVAFFRTVHFIHSRISRMKSNAQCDSLEPR